MTIGELLVEINGDNSGLKKTMAESRKAFGSLGDVAKDFIRQVGLVAIAWKTVDLAIQGINYNKAAEQAEIAFGVFLGSAEAAKNMIEEMRDLAKETPLEFADVRDAGLKLQAFGVAAEKVVPSMRMLSDVSAGLQIPIKDLAYLFGSVQAQGKALTVDLMQFANRGIPIWTELAKVTGVSGTALKKMVEEGKIGFPQVEKAFKNMTSEGGKFFQMAVKQMDSLAGSQSNLNDSFDVWLGHVTEGLTGPLKGLNTWAASFFSALVDIDKEYTSFVNVTNDWAAELFGTKANSEAIFQYWKGLAGAISNDDKAQRKFAEVAEKLSIEYPTAFARNNKDIGKTIADLSARYSLTADQVKSILSLTRSVDDKTKVLINSGLSLTATAVDYADRIKLSTSLQGEAVAAKQKELDRLADLKAKEAEKAKEIQASNKIIIDQAEERKAIEWNIIEAYKAASNYIVDNAAKQDEALAKEATGNQLVLGYQNAQIAAQIAANELEKTYQNNLKKIAELWKSVSDGLTYSATQFSSLSKSAEKFGDTDLSSILSDLSDIATDASSFVTALSKGDYISAAVSGIAVLADVWSMFWGGQSEDQKKASEEARKAEEERVAAVRKLEEEYQLKFDSDITRLEKERDERVATARAIGADVLNIERYYAGEIAKVRTKSSGTMIEEAEIAEESARIRARYQTELFSAINEINSNHRVATQEQLNELLALADKFLPTYAASIRAAMAANDAAMRVELENIESTLSLYKDRYSQAFDGISTALTDALVQGTSEADFSKSIMDMLRRMAIDAAILAGGFAEQFKAIGVLIAEALKDGLQEGEITNIRGVISSLYGSATAAISGINSLFNVPEIAVGSLPSSGNPSTASSGQTTPISGVGSSTTINISTTSDPLTIANALNNIQQSLAYQGVVA